MATLRKHLSEVVTYSFRGSGHHHPEGKHGSMQAGRVLGYILQEIGSQLIVQLIVTLKET